MTGFVFPQHSSISFGREESSSQLSWFRLHFQESGTSKNSHIKSNETKNWQQRCICNCAQNLLFDERQEMHAEYWLEQNRHTIISSNQQRFCKTLKKSKTLWKTYAQRLLSSPMWIAWQKDYLSSAVMLLRVNYTNLQARLLKDIRKSDFSSKLMEECCGKTKPLSLNYRRTKKKTGSKAKLANGKLYWKPKDTGRACMSKGKKSYLH